RSFSCQSGEGFRWRRSLESASGWCWPRESLHCAYTQGRSSGEPQGAGLSMGVHDAGSIERADGPPGNGGPSSRLGCIRVLVSNVAIGVALVVVMALLAATENSWLNGLVPLFPTFALIGQASS